MNFQGNLLGFQSKSGMLRVKREGGMLTLDFPADTLTEINPPEDLVQAIGKKTLAAFKGKMDYMLVYSRQEEIEEIAPDMRRLLQTDARGVIVTAPGKTVDFVSRFFAPQVGVPEDPVTGSAHTSLTPYWASRLNKTRLTAFQLSKRKGYLTVNIAGDRVLISGRAVTYLKGGINIEW